MPVYRYEGKQYNLPDGLTNEQAKAKIQNYLNSQSQQTPGLLDNPAVSNVKKAFAQALGMSVDALSATPQFAFLNNFSGPKEEGLRGPVEAIAHAGTSIPAFVAGLVGGSIDSAAKKVQGDKTNLPERAGEISDRLTFEPKTELGQDLSKPFDELMYRLQGLVGHTDFMGGHSGAEKPIGKPAEIPVPGIEGKAADITLRKKKERDMSGTFSDILNPNQGGVGAQGGSIPQTPQPLPPGLRSPGSMAYDERPGGLFPETLQPVTDKKTSVIPGAASQIDPFRPQEQPFGGRLPDTENPQMELPFPPEAKPVENPGQSAFNSMGADLVKGQYDEVNFPSGDAIGQMADNLLYTPAQRAVDAREAAQQFDVQRQTSLDMNASERARQEQAPVPGLAESQEAAASAERAKQTAADQQAGAVEMQSQEQLAAQAMRDAEMARMREQMEQAQKTAEAQKAVEARQTQLEFEVKKQAGLDFNAAERARQEAAPLPMTAHVEAYAEAMKQKAIEEAVAKDPQVRDMKNRVAAAEDAFMKASDALKEGKLSEGIVKRLSDDLKIMRDALDAVRERAAQTVAARISKAAEPKPITSKGSISRQRGAVDLYPLRVLVDAALEKLKTFDIPLIRGALDKYHATQSAKAFADAIKEAEKQGVNGPIADALQEAYTAASNLTVGDMENRMEAKSNRLRPGPKPRKSSPGGKQSGYILMPGKATRALQNLVDKAGIQAKLKELAPSMWTLDEAKDQVKRAADLTRGALGKAIDYFTHGGMYEALKTHNPLIRYVVEKFLEADRLARADVAQWLHNKDTGLHALMRALSKSELADAWRAIDFADFHQRPIDLQALAQRGFTAAQLRLIKAHREAMDYALTMINKARAAAGLDPITPRVAYAAHQATGDYRAMVYDKKGGNIVGVISSDFRRRLKGLRGEFEGRGYYVEKERYFGGVSKNRDAANDAFMRATEMLAQNDPHIQQFVDVLNQIRETEISRFLAMDKHTMQKKGIFGMEGRKPWQTAYDNAYDGFKTQSNYLEAAIKWGHFSEAFRDAKALIDSDEAKHMENAKQWSDDYVKNALGFNPSKAGRAFEEAVAEMFNSAGVGFSAFRRGQALTKFFVNSALLLLRPSFWVQNVVQPLAAMPGMKADLIARGLGAGFDFGTGYTYLAQGLNTAVNLSANVAGLTPLERAAERYAISHHVYGSDMIEHSAHIRKGLDYGAEVVSNATAGTIESITRQSMYYAFVHMLKENGMSEANGIFQTAHNLTDMTMNNYSSMERPKIFNSMGPVGDMAANLSSYKFNEMSRLAAFARDSMEYKSLRPIVADTLAKLAMGGVMGLVGYNEADELYHFVTKYIFKDPKSLSNFVYQSSEKAGKAIYDSTNGKIDAPYLLSNGVPSMLGVDMSKSFSFDVVPGNLFDAMFPGGSKLWDGIASLYNLTGLPSTNEDTGFTEMNLKRAALANAPLALQGEIQNQWFTKGGPDTIDENGNTVVNRKAVRPRDLKAQAYRSDSDMWKKRLGFTGIDESVQRQKTFNVERIDRDYNDLRQKPLAHMRDSIYSGGSINGKDVAAYLDARGSLDTLPTDLIRYAREQNLTPAEIAELQGAATTSIARLQKARDYLDVFQNGPKR